MINQELTGLVNSLKGKAEGDILIHDVEGIKKRAEPLLARIVETFPEYTIHDVKHSEQVLRILGWLIPQDLQSKMNSYEIFFLIVSCYLHDIGMVNFPELLDKEFRQIADEEEIRVHIRKTHHIRSERFIVNNYQKLGIEDEHQARIIGRICRGHREGLTDSSLYNNREMYTSRNIPINVPFLAALLQIADDLDMSFERTPIVIYETIKPKDVLSLQEWERHLSTCGVGLDPDNRARIIISARCWNYDIHRSLKRLEIRIQDKLDLLPDRLFQYRSYAANLPQRVLVMIETIGYETEDFKFSLQEKQITLLLMGERLYDRKETALRELLQNSYDACRLRSLLEPSIRPRISFQLSEDKSRLIVEDNGIGMNRYQVEKYFTRIGSCFYKSPEFLEVKADFNPVSTFGIGILSCFMISDHIIVETKAEDSPPLIIEIFGVEDYFLVRPGTRSDIGTTTTLFLKEDLRITLDIEREIKRYARYLEFPIEIVGTDKTKKRILPEKRFPLVDFFLESQNPATRRKSLRQFSFRSFEVKKPNLEGTFSFLCGKEAKLRLVPISRWVDRKVLRRQNKVSISYEGIFVNEINELLPPYFNRWIYIDINLHGDIVDLNVSRTGLVKNGKYTELVRRLEETILDLFREWIRIAEEEHGFLPHLRNSISTGYIAREILADYRLSLPKDVKASDALRNFFRDVYCFYIYSKNKRFFLTFRKLSEIGKTVSVLINNPLEAESYEYVKDLLRNCDTFLSGDLYFFPSWPGERVLNFCDEKREVFSSDKGFVTMFKRGSVQNPLLKIFPKSWKLVRFKNLRTDRVFEILSQPYGGRNTYVNAQNRFIALLLEKPDVILSDPNKIMVVESFFNQFKRNIKTNFDKVVETQKRILEWYKDSRIIDKVEPFILTKQQLPHHYR